MTQFAERSNQGNQGMEKEKQHHRLMTAWCCFFRAKECVNGAEVRVRERKSNIAQCFKQNPCVFDVT